MIRINLREILCFGLVGVTATLTHYLVALSSHELVAINLYLANLIGYMTAMAVSYFGHGRFTFQVALTGTNLRRFIVASVTTFLFSELLLFLLERGTELPHRVTLSLVVVSVPIFSFLLNKFWVYRL